MRGTYVIAPQQGKTLENSRRCLITCIIKVEGRPGGIGGGANDLHARGRVCMGVEDEEVN